MGSCEVFRAEVLNMRLQGQRLMDYVNTKWEEMIHDWRAVILKEQQCSYQHSIENEWTVTQHRHRGMLFASVNGFISQFALDKVQEHMALFNLTARSSLPVLFGSLWDCLVPTSSRKDCGRVRASPLMISMPTGISDV